MSTSAQQLTPGPVLPAPAAEAVEMDLLLDEVKSLISPPTICVRVLELVRSPTANAQDFAQVISTDPNLVVRLLRVVNSTCYGFPRTIDSVARAVAILGIRDLQNLVLAICAVRSLNQAGGGLGSIDAFWRHGVYVGLTSRDLARRAGLQDPERFFVSGLLHDVGIVVLYAAHPDAIPAMRAIAEQGENALHLAEIERFGFDHAELGARLLQRWDLPEALYEPLASHHQADTTTSDDAAVLKAANALAQRSVHGALLPVEPISLEPELLKRFGLDDDSALDEVIERIDNEVDSVRRAICGS